MTELPASTQKLVLALQATQDPRLAGVIERAQANHYHDFESPLPSPPAQLMADLQELGHHRLAQRVANGDFDATREEAEAWAAGEEGRATFAALLDGPRAKPMPGNRAARRGNTVHPQRGRRRQGGR